MPLRAPRRVVLLHFLIGERELIAHEAEMAHILRSHSFADCPELL